MFWKRALSGVVMMIALIFLLHFGGWPLLLMTFGLSIVGEFEFYRAIGIQKSVFAYIGYVFTAGYYLNLYTGVIDDFLLFMMLILIVFMILYVINHTKYQIKDVALAFFGVFYVPIMLSFIYRIRMHGEHGLFFVWLIFIASWGTDTCAYCVGMLIGKHKMAPILSPKKSIEGAVGGVVGATLITLIYAFAMNNFINLSDKELIISAVVTIVGAVISMYGDLAASAIKRNYNIKDYGKLIPGHGGVLDRFDSVIFTAPLMYILVFYLT